MTRGAVTCMSEWPCKGMLGEHASRGKRLDLDLEFESMLGRHRLKQAV